MRACLMQIVIGGEICCEDGTPCTDGMPSETDPHLLIGCGSIDEPEAGTQWQGAL
jgi:hypothetical protein